MKIVTIILVSINLLYVSHINVCNNVHFTAHFHK